MYRVNSSSPSTEPCGTPYWTCDRWDISSFTATKWFIVWSWCSLWRMSDHTAVVFSGEYVNAVIGIVSGMPAVWCCSMIPLCNAQRFPQSFRPSQTGLENNNRDSVQRNVRDHAWHTYTRTHGDIRKSHLFRFKYLHWKIQYSAEIEHFTIINHQINLTRTGICSFTAQCSVYAEVLKIHVINVFTALKQQH